MWPGLVDWARTASPRSSRRWPNAQDFDIPRASQMATKRSPSFAIITRFGFIRAGMQPLNSHCQVIRSSELQMDKQNTSDAEAKLQQEIRDGRKFTLEEAVARMVGPGAMKGISPVARMRQTEIEIEMWIGSHLVDSGGAFKVVLNRRIKTSELLLNNFEQPRDVILGYCSQILASEHLLRDLVRETDVEWGRAMDERPFFDREGAPRHPDDPYTFESVRQLLTHVLATLDGERAMESNIFAR
jgi:hypothetical protein